MDDAVPLNHTYQDELKFTVGQPRGLGTHATVVLTETHNGFETMPLSKRTFIHFKRFSRFLRVFYHVMWHQQRPHRAHIHRVHMLMK